MEHSLLPSRRAIKELDAMQITLNGQSHEVAEATTISELLVQLGVQTRHVAVEVNLESCHSPSIPPTCCRRVINLKW